MRFAITISLFLLADCLLQAAVHRVGTGEPLKSISEALVLAEPGDTVWVLPGVYREVLVLKKPVVLIGEHFPVLDGQEKREMMVANVSGFSISGFRFINSGKGTLEDPAALKLVECSNGYIGGNIFENNFFAIYLSGSRSCVVEDNVIISSGSIESATGNGIHAWKCDSLRVAGNLIEGHRDGIYFEFVTHSVIWRNISRRNIRYGLHFMFSHDDAYFSNVFSDNGAGVAVMFTKRVTMCNNTFRDNWGDSAFGLLLKEISDSHISGNYFTGNTCAIFIDGANRNVVHFNEIASNGWGVKLRANSTDNTFESNDFSGNTFDISTNGNLVQNSFRGNYWDKYEGYDLDRNGFGDVPYHPLSLFSVIAENTPSAMLLYRSLFVTLLDRSERVLPTLTPENFKDESPSMKRNLV